MRPVGKHIALGLVLLGLTGHAVAETPAVAAFSFHVDTPSLRLEAAPDGTDLIRIEDFRVHEGPPGAPDVPTRAVLVAIPPGAVPRLEVRLAGETLRPGVQPRPVPRERFDAEALAALDARDLERGEHVHPRLEYVPALSYYGGRETFPARPAWLGEIGVLRNQRYVAVHLAPVRYDPSIRGLRVAGRLDLTVTFEGAEQGETSLAAADPHFESVYRAAFVNYGQGRTFRLGPSDGGVLASGGGAAAAESSGPRYRIRVRANGVVRLDHTRMSGTGFLTEPLSTWKLTSRGEEVPLRVRDDDGDGMAEPTDGNDLLDPGEWVQFYGQALDDEPETVLNTDLGGPIDLHEMRDFSDENVYFLTVEAGPRSRMAGVDATPTHSRVPPGDFEAVARAEVEDAWRPLGAADPWYWSPTLSQTGTKTRTDDVPLPGLASGTAPARVVVNLQGRNDDEAVNPDHHTQITLMNASSQTLDSDAQLWDGRNLFLHDFTWTWPGSGAQLTSPAKVKFEVINTAASRNEVILDYIEVHYRRSFTAQGDTLTFDWPDQDAEFVVGGLLGSAPEVYEITGFLGGSGIVDAVRLTGVEVTGAGPFSARFRVDDTLSGGSRRFVVAGGGGVAIPANPDFEPDTVSDLRDTINQADLLVITHPDLLDDPANCADAALTALLNHRLSQNGITSRVACLEDVEDEFNDGLHGPLAIKNFLAWVLSDAPGEGWADPEPAFVLLLGDGSYDYKGGPADGSFVPTQIMFKDDPSIGYYASDNVTAAVEGGDQLADLMIGRLPVRTPGEADSVLGKLLDYEQSAAAGTWRGHALTVSDRGKGYDDFEATEFERINALGPAKMKKPPHTSRALEYWSGTDYCNKTPAACNEFVMNGDIIDAVNGVAGDGSDGTAMMQFIGHGNFDLWSDDVFFCGNESSSFCIIDDTSQLTNALRLPWLQVHNCLTGGFHTPQLKSMGESWLKRAGGGAVAVLAPSGLDFRFIGERVTNVTWSSVYGPRKERTLGVPVMEGLIELCGPGKTSVDACQNYVLMGDPTTQLQIPAPSPPTDLAAVAGNGVVDLTWTASPTPGVQYDVYRSTVAQGVYGKLNGAPVAGTAYSDTSVQNATTFYYHVVAVDGDGFDGRLSNFNTDCDLGDPLPPDADCVRGTPLNPDPPAPPGGLAVVDPETGGRLELDWADNAESDIDFYTVHWGLASGVYPNTEQVGRNSAHLLTGLTDGVEHFIAVTATNTSGHTSGFSPEQSGTPTFVRGLKSPGFISDLRIDKSGSDAVLSWTEISEDIYGKTESIDVYEVYRSTDPAFVPVPGDLIGTVTAPTTEFTDGGALSEPDDYHYLVRAVDLDGNVGGLGLQLPDGIGALQVDKLGTCSITVGQSCTTDAACPETETCDLSAGDLELSWPAVTTDFDGLPTTIERYDVYASGQPFDRAAIRDGLIPVLTSTAGTAVTVSPAPGDRYYSVIVIDTRGNASSY